MEEPDQSDFVRRLVALAALFDKELQATTQVLYFEALRDLACEDVVRAMTRAVRESKFMPKPVELRQLASGAHADPELQVEAAWLQWRALARTVGGYQSVQIADPALADTLLEMFGSWDAACWTEYSPEMWAAKRKEFGRVYRVLLERGQTAPKILAGFCERDNVTRGYLDPPTGLIATTPTGLVPMRRPEDPGAALARRDLEARVEREARRDRWRANVARALEAHGVSIPESD